MDDKQWAEWDAFLATHVRYEDTNANWVHLTGFLAQRELEFTSEALHLAYTTLGDTLELIPRVEPIAAEPPPPTPEPKLAPIPDPRAPRAWRNGKPVELSSPRPL